MNNKGVTLIEMIVAILILSISSITIAAGFNGVIQRMGKAAKVKTASNEMFSFIEGNQEVKDKVKVNKKDQDASYILHADNGVDDIEVQATYNEYTGTNGADIVLKAITKIKQSTTPLKDFDVYKDSVNIGNDLYATLNDSETKSCGLNQSTCKRDGYNDHVFKNLKDTYQIQPFPNELLPSEYKSQPFYINAFYAWENKTISTNCSNEKFIYLSTTNKYYEYSPYELNVDNISIIYNYLDNKWYCKPSNITVAIVYDDKMFSGAYYHDTYISVNGATEQRYDDFQDFIHKEVKKQNSGWYVLDPDENYDGENIDDCWISVNS